MIIYGKQVCLYALKYHEDKIKCIYIAKRGILPQSFYDQYKSKIKFLDNKWAQSMSRGGNHQGLLIDIAEIEPMSINQAKQSNFILMLDGITDAGNIGAIFRTAYTLGVDVVIISGIKKLNQASVVKTSAGAMLDMPFVLCDNILDLMNELDQIGFVRYGASMDGEPIEDMIFPGKKVLILGSEDNGLSKKIQTKMDKIIGINMKREFDSLNVSAAAAIIIHRMANAI